jgi:hypothetical protein
MGSVEHACMPAQHPCPCTSGVAPFLQCRLDHTQMPTGERLIPLLPGMLDALLEKLPPEDVGHVAKVLASWRKESVLPGTTLDACEQTLRSAHAASVPTVPRMSPAPPPPNAALAAAPGYQPAAVSPAAAALTPAKRVCVCAHVCAPRCSI